MPKDSAPIVFLLGTSTAGKSTICNEIISQSVGTSTEGKIEIWGHDQEAKKLYQERGEDYVYDGDEITKNAIDRAIKNSRNGKATVLDGVPLGFMKRFEIDDPTDYRIVEKLEEYLKSQNFDAPTQVALVHLNPKEMAARMEQRNKNALSAGGDETDARDSFRYFSQYSQLYGKPNEDGALLSPEQKIQQKDIYRAAEKFGAKDGVRIREMNETPEDLSDPKKIHEAKMKPVFAAIEEGKKLLSTIGFEDGSNSLVVGTKVKADVIFDHEKQPTNKIAEQILGFISSNMVEKPKAKEAEDLSSNKKSWVDIVSRNRSRDDSTIKR
jgi:adenylate kinase family enzyme